MKIYGVGVCKVREMWDFFKYVKYLNEEDLCDFSF